MSIFSHRRSQDSMKRFYNRIHRIYGRIETSLDPVLNQIVERRISTIEEKSRQSALEYACGSGALTCKLAMNFGAVTGRDLSSGMLDRAQRRARKLDRKICFKPGDLLNIDEANNSFDWVFVSFAVHLFPPHKVIEIIQRLFGVCRNGVMIIDHSRKRSVPTAIIEWIEGSYYDQFIQIDFNTIAKHIGAVSFTEEVFDDAILLTFLK